MIINNFTDVINFFKADDIVWACAFTETSDKECKSLFQKPIKGIFVRASDKDTNAALKAQGRNSIGYFVPCELHVTSCYVLPASHGTVIITLIQL